MKRFIALLLALVMVLALVACSGEKEPATTQGGDNATGERQHFPLDLCGPVPYASIAP